MPASPSDRPMNLLAFDTSTETLSVAVQRGSSVWEHTGPGGARNFTRAAGVHPGSAGQAGLGWERWTHWPSAGGQAHSWVAHRLQWHNLAFGAVAGAACVCCPSIRSMPWPNKRGTSMVPAGGGGTGRPHGRGLCRPPALGTGPLAHRIRRCWQPPSTSTLPQAGQ